MSWQPVFTPTEPRVPQPHWREVVRRVYACGEGQFVLRVLDDGERGYWYQLPVVDLQEEVVGQRGGGAPEAAFDRYQDAEIAGLEHLREWAAEAGCELVEVPPGGPSEAHAWGVPRRDENLEALKKRLMPGGDS